MAQILDGHCDFDNVFPEEIARHNMSMYGTGDYVLQIGECLGYELVSNNEIQIKDGMFITQGRRGYVKSGTTDKCIIENGTQSLKRHDIVVIEYSKDESTMLESHTTKLIKGVAAEEAVDPEIVTGDINSGATLHQMPLYRIKINGLNVESVEQLFKIGSVAAETVDPMLATEGGFAADALKTKKQFEKLYAPDGTEFRFGVNENGEYGYILKQGGADTVIPFSGKYKSQIIGALQNTNLELTEESSWEEIVDGIYSLFPEQLDVLAYLGIKNLSISGSTGSGAGKWHYKSSGKFDITHFNKLTYVLSLNSSSECGFANCYLYYEGGSVGMNSGSKEIDVSGCKGEAFFEVGQSQIYHSNGDYTSGGAASLTSAKLHV